jgi:hypothetical protein
MSTITYDEDLLNEALRFVKDKENPINEILTEFLRSVKNQKYEEINPDNKLLFEMRSKIEIDESIVELEREFSKI